jgi:peroxiredoxin
MLRTTFFVLLITGFVCSMTLSHGQEKAKKDNRYNQKINIGDAGPSYTNLPGADGKMHSLAELGKKDFVVIAITCNHCPVAMAYEERLINFTKKFAAAESKVAVVAINVNNNEDDRLPNMVERAKKKGYNFPYLYDESQKIARAFGAAVTPEFFVLDKQRKIAYTGSFDDNIIIEKVKNRYLEDAVGALLQGKTPANPFTPRFGCGVEWDSK